MDSALHYSCAHLDVYFHFDPCNDLVELQLVQLAKFQAYGICWFSKLRTPDTVPV